MFLWYLFGLATGFALSAVLWLLARRASEGGGIAGYPRPLVFAICSLAAIGIAAGGYAALGRTGIAVPKPSVPQVTGQADLAPQVNALEDFLRTTANSGKQNELAAQIVALEAQLRINPGSGEDWEKIGNFYFEAQRYDDAARALGQAVQLLGETAGRLANLGEAMTQANGGIVSQEAHALFVRANQLDPSLVQARFYLALALEQDGALEKAAASWRALLETAPAQAFWRPVVEQRLAAVTARLGGEAPELTGAAGDSDGLVPTPEHAATIEEMVTSLAERLEANGDDIEGWLMLLRSYRTLGREEPARQALVRAREQFSADAAALSRIEQAAESLKLR
jgi:cytochrome c-type biogenesis protein CcmH